MCARIMIAGGGKRRTTRLRRPGSSRSSLPASTRSSDSESDCEVMPLSKMVRQLSAEWKQLGEQHEAGLSPPTTPLDPAFYREAESDTER